MLLLRENGYLCEAGIIYYRGTKQRVRIALTEALESWIRECISAAQRCAAGPIPAPLYGSRKCVRCSLAPICLPDETRALGSERHPLERSEMVEPQEAATDEILQNLVRAVVEDSLPYRVVVRLLRNAMEEAQLPGPSGPAAGYRAGS